MNYPTYYISYSLWPTITREMIKYTNCGWCQADERGRCLVSTRTVNLRLTPSGRCAIYCRVRHLLFSCSSPVMCVAI